jgi:hypothetical protein
MVRLAPMLGLGRGGKNSEALTPLEEKIRASSANTLNAEAPTLGMIEASSPLTCAQDSQIGKRVKDTK